MRTPTLGSIEGEFMYLYNLWDWLSNLPHRLVRRRSISRFTAKVIYPIEKFTRRWWHWLAVPVAAFCLWFSVVAAMSPNSRWEADPQLRHPVFAKWLLVATFLMVTIAYVMLISVRESNQRRETREDRERLASYIGHIM